MTLNTQFVMITCFVGSEMLMAVECSCCLLCVFSNVNSRRIFYCLFYVFSNVGDKKMFIVYSM
jgi:hypothetical protein